MMSQNQLIRFFVLDGYEHRNEYIREWGATAGIQKHISYNSSRHSFATLRLTKGVDLYTVSKLFGHHDITTTLTYARVIDKVKDDAVSSLPILKLYDN